MRVIPYFADDDDDRNAQRHHPCKKVETEHIGKWTIIHATLLIILNVSNELFINIPKNMHYNMVGQRLWHLKKIAHLISLKPSPKCFGHDVHITKLPLLMIQIDVSALVKFINLRTFIEMLKSRHENQRAQEINEISSVSAAKFIACRFFRVQKSCFNWKTNAIKSLNCVKMSGMIVNQHISSAFLNFIRSAGSMNKTILAFGWSI